MRERTAEIQETWSKNIGRGVLQLMLPCPETTLTDERSGYLAVLFLVTKPVQQDRSARRGQSYSGPYVEPLTAFVNSLLTPH